MFRTVLLCVFVTGATSSVLAQTRQWTDRSGNSMRATMTGVLDGRVVLKAGSKRHTFLLQDFSLDDRDYIAEELKKRRQLDKLAALLQEAAKPPAVVSAPTVTLPGTTPAVPGVTSPQPAPAKTELYGLEIPSPKLLQEESAREWTDLLGNTVTASFLQVVAPAHLQLKDAAGRVQALPIVNFVRSDLESVKSVLAADWEREVFPPNSPEVTAEQRAKGYRAWTDRKGVSLTAMFVRRLGDELELEVDGENRQFPLHAVSKADQDWVTQELERQAAQRRAEAAARAASQPSTPSSSPSNPGGSAFPGGRTFGPGSSGRSYTQPHMPNFSRPQYEFKCDNCGRQWTSNTPIDQCDNCKDLYEFRCNRCGHEWTERNQIMSQCPRCAGRDSGNSGSGYGGSSGSGGSSGYGSGSGSSSYNAGRTTGRIFRGLISLAVLAAAGIGGAMKFFNRG